MQCNLGNERVWQWTRHLVSVKTVYTFTVTSCVGLGRNSIFDLECNGKINPRTKAASRPT